MYDRMPNKNNGHHKEKCFFGVESANWRILSSHSVHFYLSQATRKHVFFGGLQPSTLKILKLRTPEKIAVVILKLELLVYGSKL